MISFYKLRMSIISITIFTLTTGCSTNSSEVSYNKLFVGCKVPIPVEGGRFVTKFLHREDREGRLFGLSFEVLDPNVAPAIDGYASTRYRAESISDAGAELIRSNAKQPGRPSYYRGMSDSDQMSVNLVIFGGRAIKFDDHADYGKLAEENVVSTDNLLFLEPGWAIGVIVPKQKVELALGFKASARAALTTLLALRNGCTAALRKD